MFWLAVIIGCTFATSLVATTIAHFDGARAKKIFVQPGEHVLKNQLLFILDDETEKEAILQARKKLQEAKATLSKCFINAQRQKDNQDLECAEKTLAASLIDLEEAKNAFKQTRVSAPFDAIISTKEFVTSIDTAETLNQIIIDFYEE